MFVRTTNEEELFVSLFTYMYTVLVKCKLPVSSPFSRDERAEILWNIHLYMFFVMRNLLNSREKYSMVATRNEMSFSMPPCLPCLRSLKTVCLLASPLYLQTLLQNLSSFNHQLEL